MSGGHESTEKFIGDLVSRIDPENPATLVFDIADYQIFDPDSAVVTFAYGGRGGLGIVVWNLPLKLVLAQALAGVDLAAAAPVYVQVDLAVSLALVPAAWLLARGLGKKFRDSPRFQAVLDSLAGSDMAAAREFMQRLTRFEAESTA